MSPVLVEAKRYLYRYGTVTDATIEPIDLIRDLTRELEKHEGVPITIKTKKSKAKPKRRTFYRSLGNVP
jgi:hypothetical protein